MYTEKKHAKNLLEMLSEEDPCSCCPYPDRITERNDPTCGICRAFVNLKAPIQPYTYLTPKCPCHVLGKEEAIKRTWLKLEKENYI